MNSALLLESASGYLFLGMPEECLEELREVDFQTLCSERYMTLKLAALTATRDWRDAFVAARMLMARYPDNDLAYTSGATCLIEMGRYLEAVEFLLDGPSSLRRKAMTHLQIAYCEFKLGFECAARYSLEEARKIDPDLVFETAPHLVSSSPEAPQAPSTLEEISLGDPLEDSCAA